MLHFIYYVIIRSAQANIKHLSNKQLTLIWEVQVQYLEVPLASIKCRILFLHKNELVMRQLDTVHLDASSHQSIVRGMKTSVMTENKKLFKTKFALGFFFERKNGDNTWVAMARIIKTTHLHKNFQILQTQHSRACLKPIKTT